MKAREEKRAAVKAELKNKKKGTGGLFGEDIGGPDEGDAMFKTPEDRQEDSDPTATKNGKSSGHETAEDALNGGSADSLHKGQDDAVSVGRSAKGGTSTKSKAKKKKGKGKGKPKQD